MRYTFFAALALVAGLSIQAQYPAVTIPGSEVRKITSAIVQGQEYELQILLPGGYAAATKQYPVVYLMDAQWDFPLVKSIYGQQYYDGFIPELIIVGVTWGGVKPNADSLRARDYTPSKENRLTQSGGAGKFLDFMSYELFPFMEKNYRVDRENRVLMGCSLGGLLTIYTLLSHPGMFTGYIAASPAVGWDNGLLYKYEQKFAEILPAGKKIRLYLTVGDVERNRGTFESFSAYLISKNYKDVSIRSKVLENTGHSGTKSETYTRGLQYVFEKPDLQLPDETLKALEGRYQQSDGFTVDIKVNDHRLNLVYLPNNSYPLKASSGKTFYSDAEFLNIEFSEDGKTLKVNRYGSTNVLIKK